MKKGWSTRLLSAVLALVLVFQLLPPRAWQAEAAGAEGAMGEDAILPEDLAAMNAPAEERPEGLYVTGELEERRGESEKHFRMSDGSFIAVDYGIPVHYKTEEEQWTDIDNTLTPLATLRNTEDTTAQYTAANGGNSRAFAGSLASGFLFAASNDGHAVQMSLVDTAAEPAVEAAGTMAADEPEGGPAGRIQEPAGVAAGTEEEAEAKTALPETEAAEETPSEPVPTSAEIRATEEAASELDPSLDNTPRTEPASIPMETEATEAGAAETEPTETEPALPDTAPSYNRQAEARIIYPDRQPALFSAQAEASSFSDQIKLPRLRAQVLYEQVYSGVDFLYELYSLNVKESIILHTVQSGYVYSFRLELDGLTPALREDGSISLLDSQERELYYIPAPYMTDSDGACSEAVFYTLAQEAEGGWLLTVTADAGWIEAPDRAFPVVIDPTIIDQTSKTYEFHGDTVCSKTDAQISSVGNVACGYHGAYGQMEVYFKLDAYPEIPTGCTLAGAYVGLVQNDFRSGSDSTAGKMLLSLHANTSGAPMDTSLTWATKPGYGPTLDYIEVSYSTINDIQLWDVTPAAKQWYDDESTNLGLAMTSDSDAGAKCRAWFTRNSRVTFVAVYRDAAGLEPYYSYQGLGAGNAGSAYLSDYTGQLTVVKELVSYASGVNPFSLRLVYNSSYFQKDTNANYDPCGALGFGMRMGSGTKLNVIQRVEKVQLQNDSGSGNTETYLKYTDGDGTVHYFAKDPNKNDGFYYDEDGLGLKINEYATNYFKMLDDQDNERIFINGVLGIVQDANGNRMEFRYIRPNGDTSTWYPSGSGDRLDKIVQKNKGGAEITMAAFRYDSGTYLTGVTDAAGNVYQFEYANYKLSSVKRNGTPILRFGLKYDSALNIFVNQVDRIFDPEARYGIAFTWEDGRVSSYREITDDDAWWEGTGAQVLVSHRENGQTVYRDLGMDRAESGDDIYTYYAFDHAGRTVNAYSTTAGGAIIGAANAVYSGAGSVDKTNNRTLKTASIGAAAQQELRNVGFESTAADLAWTPVGAGGSDTNAVIKSDKTRTGNLAFKCWGRDGKTGLAGAYRETNGLNAGTAYTLSACVNTSESGSLSGDGVYLQVTDGSGNTWKSECVGYKTSGQVDGGWARLSLTFRTEVSGVHTVGIYNDGLGGVVYADDFQLERGEAPSNVNLLENGSFQYRDYGWTKGANAGFVTGCGVNATDRQACSMEITGDPAKDTTAASQTVSLNLPGTQTYVLSGWAKANAVPDNVTTATGDDAAAKDKNKQFGLRAVLTYTDNTTENHYVPFNPALTGWQFASLAIVPRQANKTVRTIQVVCAYEKNANTAWFDDISLVREAAQTMKYDENGKLVSVKSTDNSEAASEYENGNLIQSVTGGGGTFTYEYDGSHNVTQVTNGLQKENIAYDANGNATGFTLSQKDGAGAKITSSAGYTNSGNLTASVTDARGNTTRYTYSTNYSAMLGSPTDTVNANGVNTVTVYDANLRRLSMTYINGVASVAYGYDSRGNLSALTRGGWLPGQSGAENKKNQTYGFTYDAFGNTTSVSVGGRQLASYEYGAKNGPLARQNYGNGAYTAFTYDNLGRITQTQTSSGDTYRYTYTGDGQLYRLEDVAGNTAYRYNYDSIGRLTGSTQKTPAANLTASYQYDDNNRVTTFAYSIPGIIDSAYEAYSYNSNSGDSIPDGALTSMVTTNGYTMSFAYDGLGRLSAGSFSNKLQTAYSYLAGASGGTTTTLVSGLKNTISGSTVAQNYQYQYDKLGNMTQVKDAVSNKTTDYTYDNQGQLLTAVSKSGSTVIRREVYTYDTYGNIRTASDGITTHSYTYGDTEWLDLLTAYDGNAITYDAIGNPLSYYDGTAFTWTNGRQLQSLTTGGKTYSYEYNVNGLRTRKVKPDGTSIDYYIVDGQTIAERWNYANGSEYFTMRYVFDQNGSVIGFCTHYPGFPEGYFEHYLFAKNLQGDVVAMYTVGSGLTLIATYEYDSWGKVLSIKDSNGAEITNPSHLALRQPFRYRSYHYDMETGFYYLRSRYYDSSLKRFINADNYAGTGQAFLGFNMFAYCLNNPVQYVDFDGNASFWYFLIIDSDFGFIHRMVQREIALKYNVSKELWVSKGGEKVGRVDIMRSNGSIWEVKHGTNNPIVRKARMIAAKWQAEQYLGAKADRNDVAASNLGEVGAFSGSFMVECRGQMYLVTYETPADGVILYYVQETQKSGKPDYVYVPKADRGTEKTTLPQPQASYTYGGGPGPLIAPIPVGIGGGGGCRDNRLTSILF